MSKLFILTIFLLSGKCFAQPSLSAFTATQQAQIKAYTQWQGKKSADSVKATLTPITKGTVDSLVNFAKLYKAQQGRQDSASIALKSISTTVSTIQGSYVTSTETGAIKASVTELQTKQQATADLVAAIKLWVDRVSLINFK